jgi:nucleoside 2-deoxyribosyltransferase
MGQLRELQFCGEPWTLMQENGRVICLEKEGFGTVFVTKDVIIYLNKNKDLQYKILSVLYEQHLLKIEKRVCICIREEQKCFFEDVVDKTCFTIAELLGLFPENIAEILERTLLNLSRQFPNRGQEIILEDKNQERKILPYYCCFAKDEQEQQFIINAMREKKWLFDKINIHGMQMEWPLKITVTGWLAIANTLKRTDSKNVFVAMKFDDSTNTAWEYMQKAISELGFNPIRIDKVKFNDEINGQILLHIKQSAFVVADITGHRNGVYFEAGFAMGLKKDVIFACSEVSFKETHFDVSHYNIIIWRDEQDLYEKLKDRIQGTIALK